MLLPLIALPPNTSKPCSDQTAPASTSNTPMTTNIHPFIGAPSEGRHHWPDTPMMA
jgi:hypothetical protein